MPQGNATFTQKDGSYYVEKWKSENDGGWTGLKLYQLITDLPNGQYKLTAAALNTLDVGGAYIYGNDSTVEVFVAGNYTLDVTVENNELEIGYEVVNGGNYVGTDNFQLNYYGTEPIIEVSESSLTCDVFNPTSTFTVSGYNLTEGISISAPNHFTVDTATIELLSGNLINEVTVTVSYDVAASTTGDIIISSNGASNHTIAIAGVADPVLTISEAFLTFDDQIPHATFTVTGGNLTEDISITAPTGFSVDNTTVGQSAGETTITATFDATAETKDYITITSSGVTERVRVLGYLNTLTPLYPLATDLNSDPYMTEIDNFYGWGGRSITKDTTLIYSGISTGLISGGSLDCLVTFSPNTYYRVKAMVKAATSACTMGYYGGDADVNFGVDANNVGVWAPLDFTFQSDATTSLAEGLGIFFNGSAGSYVDNWEIYIMPMYVTADSIKFLEAGNAAVNVIAQALSGDVSITAPTGYSVSPSTITAGTIADVAITVTYDGTSNANGYIYLTGIDATDSVYVEGSISTGLVPQSASAPYLVFVNNDRINVNFELAQGANMQFTIYNMQGTLVATEQSTFSAGSHTKVLNADLSSGAYLINIIKGGQSQTYKIIK
ncbi:MAG: T9SS type A sorting domain-containing protein [Bacteroidales bacterium]|nr:T9SS type A sorting domain-containing protein [Bacteroidales bacterium]